VDCTENIMNVHITKNGALLNTWGKYYIHNETKNDNQINDKIEFWIIFCLISYRVMSVKDGILCHCLGSALNRSVSSCLSYVQH
jgi:hypothetical protein